MKTDKTQLVAQAEETLRSLFRGVPFLRVKSIQRGASRGGLRPDLRVQLATPKKDLIVEVKANGQPRFAREAINRLTLYGQAFPNSYGILMAPYISPEAARICGQAGMGYVDLSGNLRLCFDPIFLEREGKPNQFGQRRELRSLYAPKATRIHRVLLSHPKKAWRLVELAGEAKVSLGQTANVKKLLMDREWIQLEPEGWVLTHPELLLREWAENYSFRRNDSRDYYSLQNSVQLEAALAELAARENLHYALTMFSAAMRLAPAVRHPGVFAYVAGNLQLVAEKLGLQAVSSGANVCLLSPYDQGVFYGAGRIRDSWVASPVQVYLDLYSYRGRGEEAAQAIWQEIIQPSW